MTDPLITARAHTNIALIKYWGKKDQDLIIPMNNSLSLTLDHFYTDTSVQFDHKLTHDVFILDGQVQNNQNVVKFMDLIRQKAGIHKFAQINSINHVPSTAGLASSASAYAALAASASLASGMKLNHKELSRLARRGSGSASRSIYGGFVEWVKADNNGDSYALPIDEHPNWKIGMLVAMINPNKKKISSRKGMQIVTETSPFYSAWVNSIDEDLSTIKTAIQEHDFNTLGQVAESNALRMHALNLSARPHFNYFEPLSLEIMNAVEKLRDNDGIPCYYTLDAGPNVKILCEQKNQKQIQTKLEQKFPMLEFAFAKPGPGIEYLN